VGDGPLSAWGADELRWRTTLRAAAAAASEQRPTCRAQVRQPLADDSQRALDAIEIGNELRKQRPDR
jgi:hypothetical protein